MTSLKPAVVTARAAAPLPRLALLLFCAAYLVPGAIGREPWKNADIAAFGYMLNVADGDASWLSPMVGHLPPESGSVVPYAIGAAFIHLLGWAFGPVFAARLPFISMLGLTLALTWYTTYNLARTEAARPIAFAFGGEATVIDYARAMADGALLALIASLGLLQLGHETTPELVQLMGTALWLYGMAVAPYGIKRSRAAVIGALVLLATSGAPALAMALSVIAVIISWRSSYADVRRLVPWAAVGGALAAAAASAIHGWGWRVAPLSTIEQPMQWLRLLAWFTWPAWPLALWTLWRWRRHLAHRHISVPLSAALLCIVACGAMGASDRALLLALPGLAVLSAFALPTMQRQATALIDWLSVFFFSFCALALWVIYGSLMTGVPAKPGANVLKLAPGFEPSFSWVGFVVAAAGTLAWVWLVRWRTGRHRHPLWKSLVLPASGVALCWLMLTTLWLPTLDYARSYKPQMDRIRTLVPPGACLAAPGVARSQLAALEYYGDYQVDGVTSARDTRCDYLLVTEHRPSRSQPPVSPPVPSGWTLIGRAPRPTDRDEVSALYRRR